MSFGTMLAPLQLSCWLWLRVLRSVISGVRSGSNAKRFKSVATEISNIFCRDLPGGLCQMGTFCGQERTMLHYITTLSVDIRMIVG
jgi:hypothetical protein